MSFLKNNQRRFKKQPTTNKYSYYYNSTSLSEWFEGYAYASIPAKIFDGRSNLGIINRDFGLRVFKKIISDFGQVRLVIFPLSLNTDRKPRMHVKLHDHPRRDNLHEHGDIMPDEVPEPRIFSFR